MTGPETLDVARDAIWTIVIVSSPLMVVGLVVGVVVSLFQALTQIQEQTLIYVPKIVTVFGVFAGSLVTALATGRFKLEGYRSPQHMLRSAGGAVLMGAGGVMAFGCSVGQGLTGLSTLSLSSFIAIAGIMLGTAAGLRGALRVRPLATA